MEAIDWLTQVEIRLGLEGDLPALEWNGEYIHFRRLYSQVYQSACEGRALIWVADLVDEGLIGQLFVQLSSGRKELADGVSRAYIYGFRVKPDYRDSGLGTRMLEAAEQDLIDRRFKWISLNVGQENHGALRFYHGHGYQVIGVEPGRWSYIDHLGEMREVNEPAWRMEKQIHEDVNNLLD
jgi:ribosomal protein S18 acetylase RimI-like enzyme